MSFGVINAALDPIDKLIRCTLTICDQKTKMAFYDIEALLNSHISQTNKTTQQIWCYVTRLSNEAFQLLLLGRGSQSMIIAPTLWISMFQCLAAKMFISRCSSLWLLAACVCEYARQRLSQPFIAVAAGGLCL